MNSYSNIVKLCIFLFIISHGSAYEKYCGDKLCITKCCKDGEKIAVIDSKPLCVQTNGIPETPKNYNVKNEYGENVGFFEDFYRINKNARFQFNYTRSDCDDEEFLEKANLLTDGTFVSIYEDSPISYQIDKFCIDWDEHGAVQFGIGKSEVDSDEKIDRTVFFFITSFFLLIVFIVYSVVEDLKNFMGKMFTCYVFSLFCAVTLFAIFRTLVHYKFSMSQNTVLSFNFFIYFFFMASFLWMNVLSFDIWRTFRSMILQRERRNIRRFIIYCTYAWGVALILSINLIVLEVIEVPNIIRPNIRHKGNFLTGEEKMLYLYTPMLILLISNLIFFILTVYILYRCFKDSSQLCKSKKQENLKKRFTQYIKLSLVMGISWILEVASTYRPESYVWIVFDYYNLLVGPIIFIFFVCPKGIRGKVLNKIRGDKEQSQYSGGTIST